MGPLPTPKSNKKKPRSAQEPKDLAPIEDTEDNVYWNPDTGTMEGTEGSSSSPPPEADPAQIEMLKLQIELEKLKRENLQLAQRVQTQQGTQPAASTEEVSPDFKEYLQSKGVYSEKLQRQLTEFWKVSKLATKTQSLVETPNYPMWREDVILAAKNVEVYYILEDCQKAPGESLGTEMTILWKEHNR